MKSNRNDYLFDAYDLAVYSVVAILVAGAVWLSLAWLDANFVGIVALGDQGVPGEPEHPEPELLRLMKSRFTVSVAFAQCVPTGM